MSRSWQHVAVILTAHGERRPDATNRSLLAHVAALKDMADFAGVWAGVLTGEPTIEKAIAGADASGASEVLVYPFFMSHGTIVHELLPKRISSCRSRILPVILPPLGLEPRLIALLSAQAIASTRAAGFAPSRTRLLVVGHGSRLGGASAFVTRRAAGLLEATKVFASVDVAFLEEPPLLANQLAIDRDPVVVLGFFSGEGVHAWQDVPAAIESTGAQAVYTGPVGACPEIPEVIMAGLERWRSDVSSRRSSPHSSRRRQ